MVEIMKVNGKTITWKESVAINGATADNMKVNILKIKNMGLGSIIGLMGEYIWVIGIKENNMALVLIKLLMNKSSDMGFGKMEKE